MTAIDNYFNSSYKNMVSFAKEEKISAKELHEILGHDRKSERRKNRFYQKMTIVY
jgi:hypothetical protein